MSHPNPLCTAVTDPHGDAEVGERPEHHAGLHDERAGVGPTLAANQARRHGSVGRQDHQKESDQCQTQSEHV